MGVVWYAARAAFLNTRDPQSESRRPGPRRKQAAKRDPAEELRHAGTDSLIKLWIMDRHAMVR